LVWFRISDPERAESEGGKIADLAKYGNPAIN
jgi:hypothetical protein